MSHYETIILQEIKRKAKSEISGWDNASRESKKKKRKSRYTKAETFGNSFYRL